MRKKYVINMRLTKTKTFINTRVPQLKRNRDTTKTKTISIGKSVILIIENFTCVWLWSVKFEKQTKNKLNLIYHKSH